jgi:hypothetical protein
MQGGPPASVRKGGNQRYQRGSQRDRHSVAAAAIAVAFLTLNVLDPTPNRKCNFTVSLRPINGATFGC